MESISLCLKNNNKQSKKQLESNLFYMEQRLFMQKGTQAETITCNM